jgi:seryl-tRNA synthetase
MIDIKYLRENDAELARALENRNAKIDLAALRALDEERRRTVHAMEQLRAQQNAASQQIGAIKKAGGDASEAMAQVSALKQELAGLEDAARNLDEQMTQALLTVPNPPDASVPVGPDDGANRVEKQWGEPRSFDFEPKDHVAIGEALGILDFERAAKVTGSRFCFARGGAAQLERALINFMLDIHTREHGYTEVLPPFIVNADSMRGTGQLPKFAGDSFRVEEHGYYLIPTAEVPVTNYFRDEILPVDALPVSFCAYSPCFRSEAGSYGKDTRGMIRQHQFNKVEMVKFCTPESSWEEHEKLTRNAEVILERLELPYQRVTLSTGDMGFASAKTYDLEVWLPGQGAYREISSCSNFTDFQARRANIRFKRDKKPEFVHTINGSGLAVGRTLVAILENYQQEDGSVKIPDALKWYMGGLEAITPA